LGFECPGDSLWFGNVLIGRCEDSGFSRGDAFG
jgi:hypothetical protein